MNDWKEYATKELNYNPLEMSEYKNGSEESDNVLYLFNNGPTSVRITLDNDTFKARVCSENTYAASVRTYINADIIEVLIGAIKSSFKCVDKWKVVEIN